MCTATFFFKKTLNTYFQNNYFYKLKRKKIKKQLTQQLYFDYRRSSHVQFPWRFLSQMMTDPENRQWIVERIHCI